MMIYTYNVNVSNIQSIIARSMTSVNICQIHRVNQSIICAVFDPKVDFHGLPTASLLSLSLMNCSYLLSSLHLFMSSNHMLHCLPTPRLASIIPSNTLVISLPFGPLQDGAPHTQTFYLQYLLHKIPVFFNQFQNLII